MTPELLALISLAASAIAVVISIVFFVVSKRAMEMNAPGRNRAHSQLSGDLANMKREVALLTETVSRFRTQSLAGITENITEQEKTLRQSLVGDLRREINLFSGEVDKAMHLMADKFDSRQREFIVEITELRQSLKDLEANVQSGAFAAPPEVKEEKVDLTQLSQASVVNRFISSLDSAEDRRKCILASLDSVLDIPTLGKLAVAYPSENSWLILKELADHGVVSNVAGWALVAGADLSFARGHAKLAEDLYQSARLSFSLGGENHAGLFCVSLGLPRVLEGSSSQEVITTIEMERVAQEEALRQNPAADISGPCLQLAEFYLSDERFECAAILFLKALLLESRVDPGSDSPAWTGFSRALRAIVLSQKADRELFDYLPAETLTFMLDALRSSKLLKEDAVREGILLAVLRLCERERDSASAFSTIAALMNQIESGRATRDHKAFLAGEVLSTMDELGLSRKAAGLPILKQLVEIFLRSGALNKAASAGAKLVDVSLDLFGDASLETVQPIDTLARVYKDMKRYDLAEECYRQILEVCYKVYPSEHEDMIEVLLNLAEVCKLQDDDGEAEIFMESAMEMSNHLLGEHKQSDLEGEFEDSVKREKAMKIMARVESLKSFAS